jgi:hypothetical protein
VSPILYGFVDAPPGAALGEGAAGEPIALWPCGPLAAAVGALDAAPAASPEALAAHDRAVRRIAERVRAILPARFGTMVDDAAALERWVAPRAALAARALQEVAGCEQMTVRLFTEARAAATPPPDEEPPDPALGPGTRWLRARARALALPPEATALSAALASEVRGERIERTGEAQLVSLFHLIPRGSEARYREALAGAASRLALTVRASGPWPPYAFAASLAGAGDAQ